MYSKNYYSILGITSSAEEVVIRAAYKALAQRYHPDKYQGEPNDGRERMQELNEAYSVLSDPERKHQYDHWLKQQHQSDRYGTDEKHDEQKTQEKPTNTEYSEQAEAVNITAALHRVKQGGVWISHWCPYCKNERNLLNKPFPFLPRVLPVAYRCKTCNGIFNIIETGNEM